MGGCVTRLPLYKHEHETSTESAVATSPPYNAVNQSSVRLFGRDSCLDTARIRIALQHKGVGAELVWINSEGLKGNKGQTLLSAFTGGKFPLLQHEETVVCASMHEILDYIDKTFPHPPLTRTGMHEDALQDWVQYVRDDFTPIVLNALNEGNPFIQHADLAPKLDAAFTKLDSGIAEHSTRGPFFMGEYFSLVDVYLIPTLELLPTLTYFRGVRINPTNSYNLIAYASRIRSFPSYFPVKVDITHVEMAMWRTLAEKAQPAILCMTILQHRSIICHLQSFIEFADELSRTNQGPRIIDPVKGSMGMQIKKFGKACGRLIELMHEHAQMEERMVFPPLEDADKGVTKTVNGYHARDLPVTNGIREDVKALMTIEKGTSDFKDTLVALILRLRSLQAYTTQHFQEEEQELLPLLAAAGLGNTQQEALVISCVDLMEATHGHHLPYFLLGLQPHEMHQYMLMMQKCSEDGQIFKRMMHTIQNADDEFENVRKEIGERMLSIASAWEIY